MSKLNHKQKIKIARRLMTNAERLRPRAKDGKKYRTPLFQSKGWEARTEQIKKRVAKVQHAVS